MRSRTTLVAVTTALLCAVSASQAFAADADLPRQPAPAWLTDDLKAKIHAAGADGVQVSEEYLNTECPGFQTRGVSANGCIVAPYGCTANFIFTDGGDWTANPYIGTASHCTDKNGEAVIMQVDTTTLAEVGTVYRQTAGEDPGDDFALIRIYPEVAQKWGVNPAIPTGGPQGIYDGCGPAVVKNYGHGYVVAVGQGKPEAGVAPHWYNDGYGWFGYGVPGDSGSGIVLADDRSAGDFTHIIIYDPKFQYVTGELVGMRTTAILRWLGPGWSQVNADGSTSRIDTTACGGGDDGGSGGGGSGGGGNGGGKKDGGGKPSGKGGGKRA